MNMLSMQTNNHIVRMKQVAWLLSATVATPANAASNGDQCAHGRTCLEHT